MSQPDTVAPGDWLGLPHRRPGLMRPRDYQLARLEAKRRAADPARERPAPDRVLCRRPIATLEELVALCNGAKLALGVTAKTPRGQLGPGWTWWARHGAGASGTTGRITESLYLRCDRPPRSALFIWSRPVPSPVLMIALVQVVRSFPWTFRAPAQAAVLAQLPALDWSAEYVTSWTTTATGRPEDIPRVTPSAVVKKEIRS
jgi:hypothetical protein